MIARRLNVHYDIVPSHSDSANAVNFNVSTWTMLPYLAGRTGFTTNMLAFQPDGDDVDIISAMVRCVFQSGNPAIPSVQVASLYYDASGGQVWDYTLGTFTRRPAYNPDNQGVDITAKLKALLALPAAAQPQLTVRVNGQGILHEARLEVCYQIPDLSDDLARLALRLDALEAAARG